MLFSVRKLICKDLGLNQIMLSCLMTFLFDCILILNNHFGRYFNIHLYMFANGNCGFLCLFRLQFQQQIPSLPCSLTGSFINQTKIISWTLVTQYSLTVILYGSVTKMFSQQKGLIYMYCNFTMSRFLWRLLKNCLDKTQFLPDN